MAAPTGQTHDRTPTAIVTTPNQHLTQGRRPHMTRSSTRLGSPIAMRQCDASRAESWYPGDGSPLLSEGSNEVAEVDHADWWHRYHFAACLLRAAAAIRTSETYRAPNPVWMSDTTGGPCTSPLSRAWLGRGANLRVRMRIVGRPPGSTSGTRPRVGIATPGCSNRRSVQLCTCAKARDDHHPHRHAWRMGARAAAFHNQPRTAGRERYRSCFVSLAPQANGTPEGASSKSEERGVHHCGGRRVRSFRGFQDLKRGFHNRGKYAWNYMADF